jgi:hypothetical protein
MFSGFCSGSHKPWLRFGKHRYLCIACLVPTWLIAELIPTKLPHYVLPGRPAGLCRSRRRRQRVENRPVERPASDSALGLQARHSDEALLRQGGTPDRVFGGVSRAGPGQSPVAYLPVAGLPALQLDQRVQPCRVSERRCGRSCRVQTGEELPLMRLATDIN